jgi:CPA2 family monovalent cation:H+ antiporter-2
VILELNADTVRKAKAEGEPIIYGDITSKIPLIASGIDNARLIVFAISDPAATRIGLKLAHSFNPGIYSIIRTRYLNEIDELLALGANEVIPEEFETSVEIFSRVLDRLHVPRNVIEAEIKLIRSGAYRMLRTLPGSASPVESLSSILASGTTSTFLIRPGTMADGKCLKALKLRSETGATIIAVVRDDVPTLGPPLELQLRAGDVLVMIGSHAAMTSAFKFLETKMI